jgi:hypothetical protein
MSEWGDGGRKRSRVPSCARHVRMRESRWPFAPMAGASGWAMLVLLATAAACSGKGTTPCTDANVELIQASNYDQSCTVDADCVSIAVGDACYPCLVICQVGGAINRGALSSYRSDISKTIRAMLPRRHLQRGPRVRESPCGRQRRVERAARRTGALRRRPRLAAPPTLPARRGSRWSRTSFDRTLSMRGSADARFASVPNGRERARERVAASAEIQNTVRQAILAAGPVRPGRPQGAKAASQSWYGSRRASLGAASTAGTPRPARSRRAAPPDR